MFFYEGYICPVCEKRFQESDDIVACPECGAPHHRECWMREGHCHFAADHGTSRQWKRPAEPSADSYRQSVPPSGPAQSTDGRVCPQCGHHNPEYAEFCARCGHNLSASEWQSNAPGQWPGGSAQGPSAGQPPYGNYPPYGNRPPFNGRYGEYAPIHMPVNDAFGGIAHDETVNGVSAEDLVSFIGPSSSYYLPRAVRMERSGSGLSWNWVAFLLSPYWLLYRKNYLAGGLVLLFDLIQTFVNSLVMGLYIQPQLDMSSDAAMFRSLYALVAQGNMSLYVTIISLLSFVSLLVHIIFGMIGNRLYIHNCVSRIRKIRTDRFGGELRQLSEVETAEYRAALTQAGGVSFVLVAVAFGIVWFGQLLFQALFLY